MKEQRAFVVDANVFSNACDTRVCVRVSTNIEREKTWPKVCNGQLIIP